ncbi:hypothetical protein FRC11_005539 [Ceratobasidium sp. 423]|nr:hypothetical protein FRC11_005539 [Ceratobasidium sp. 423]
MIRWSLGVLVLSTLARTAFPSYPNEFIPPKVLLSTPEVWSNTKAAQASIVKFADEVLREGPWSMMNKSVVPPSGNKHDYLSYRPYYWPNCTGVGNTTELTQEQIYVTCPYERRDGQFNPDYRLANDSGATQALMDALFYAPHHLQIPRPQYSQTSRWVWLRGPGTQVGSPTGVLDMHWWPKALSGILLMKEMGVWSDADLEGVVNWAKAYIPWLRMNELAKAERASDNNHGSYFFNQLAALEILVGDLDGAKATVQDYFTGIYMPQIDEKCDQPKESARTHPYHYRGYNLCAMINNARLAEFVGYDGWNAKASSGGGIQATADHAMQFTPGPGEAASELFPQVKFGDPSGKYAAFLASKDQSYPGRPSFLWNQPLSDSGLAVKLVPDDDGGNGSLDPDNDTTGGTASKNAALGVKVSEEATDMDSKYQKLSDLSKKFPSHPASNAKQNLEEGAIETQKGLLAPYRAFNIADHQATVQTTEGNMTLPFAPTQSDAVTILSSMFVAHKWALAAWVTPLCWRIAIFLMDRHGLHHQDFNVLIKYRMLTPGTVFRSFPTLIIGTLLLTSLAANLSSPILTGSIAWIPKNQPVPSEPPIGSIGFQEIKPGIFKLADIYLNGQFVRNFVTARAIGLVSIGWGRNVDKQVYKRVSGSVEALAIGSVIESVTLPYFAVDSIKWIENEDDVPTYAKNETNPDVALLGALEWGPSALPALPPGYAALIPTNPTNWSDDPLDPTTIEETRLLVLALEITNVSIPNTLPRNTYILEAQGEGYMGDKYAYAWVSFRAGASTCKGYRCVISSPSTISTLQNDPKLSPEPHTLTFQALSMALAVSCFLVMHNSSIPYPSHSIDDYVEAILIRSYSATWNVMNDLVGSTRVYSNYRPALPVLIAQVDHARVYGWLGLQLLVTLLGLIFLILQFGLSKFPLIGDTSLMAFYLDTTGIPREGNSDPFENGELKIEQVDDRLAIVRSGGAAETTKRD